MSRNYNPPEFPPETILTPEIEATMSYRVALCPICKEYCQFPKDDNLHICNSCKSDINYCNSKLGHSCFNCSNEYVYAEINEEKGFNPFKNIKTRKYYGCWKGSRLFKACYKLKMAELEVKKYLRWRNEPCS